MFTQKWYANNVRTPTVLPVSLEKLISAPNISKSGEIMKANSYKISVLIALIFLIGVPMPLISTVSAQRYSNCSLIVNINRPDAGTVEPGSGTFYYGDYVLVREYTNPGYSFDGWYLNNVYQGKLSTISITMTQDYTLLAVFSKRIVSLAITDNPAEGGATVPPAGVWNYTYGDTINIKESPNQGYSFSGWYLDGNYQGNAASLTLTMDTDHQLSAFFAGGDNNTPAPVPTATPMPTPAPTSPPNLPLPQLVFYCTSSTKYSGFNVKIEGMLSYEGVGLSGAGVMFSYSVTGGASWEDLAYVNTGDDGSFSAVWMPSASGNYFIKATWQGDEVYSSVTKVVSFAITDTDNQDQNVFTLASNSTLTSFIFDSTKSELSFGVSGPFGTVGYVQVCVPKSLLADASDLKITLDGYDLPYDVMSKNDVWLITMIYPHSSHTVVVALNGVRSSGFGSFMTNFGNELVLGTVIAVLAAIVAALLYINRRNKNRFKIA